MNGAAPLSEPRAQLDDQPGAGEQPVEALRAPWIEPAVGVRRDVGDPLGPGVCDAKLLAQVGDRQGFTHQVVCQFG